jgi:propionate CoA-transferase
MDPAIFEDVPMALADRPVLPLDERVRHDAADNVLFVNLEGLVLSTPDEVEEIESFLATRAAGVGRRVNLVVNYDNFELGRLAAPAFFAMVRDHRERYYLSTTRYSSQAFRRRRLGEDFAHASLEQRIYPSFEDATAALADA